MFRPPWPPLSACWLYLPCVEGVMRCEVHIKLFYTASPDSSRFHAPDRECDPGRPPQATHTARTRPPAATVPAYFWPVTQASIYIHALSIYHSHSAHPDATRDSADDASTGLSRSATRLSKLEIPRSNLPCCRSFLFSFSCPACTTTRCRAVPHPAAAAAHRSGRAQGVCAMCKSTLTFLRNRCAFH